ncbi:MAG: membrane protein insertase YidC [Syntrophaceae bacterium]|nr:membrane protein insertase YidC [Syntrophaceae bacterium]
MEKRAILAIILTFLIIFAWGVIQSRFYPPEPRKEVRKEETTPSEKKVDLKETKPLSFKEERPLLKKKVLPRKEVSVETQNYWAVFTSDDAGLKHFKFKKYQDRVEESAITVKLTQLVENLLGKKEHKERKPQPLDLVNTREEEGLPLRLTLFPFSSEGGWEIDKDQLRLLNPGEEGRITFTKTLENGLRIIKRYGVRSDRNSLDVELEIENPSSKEATLQLGMEWIGRVELEKLADEGNKDYGLRYSFMKDQKVERKEFGSGGGSGCTPGCGAPKRRIEPFESSTQGDIRWYAFEGEYFAALLIPPPSEKRVTLSVKGDEKNLLRAALITSPVSIPAKQGVKIPYRVYIGPKEGDRLKEMGVGAEKLVDFGFFTIVAKPLLWFLKLTNSVTKNYGIDIIILSILIKIIFLPLTQISFKSMKEMQKVQPEMKRLKELYKNDKARLQQEMMLLYKRRRINPMSGCLPMLIQIPVFIALYNALQNAIEMRHAPFFLWIRDLSAKDPIYITPLIMGATMVIQQKMTPSAADPAQAKLFMLMPIMFTFLFLNFPAGLVLYWLINNVLSIGHQYYLNRRG